MSTLLARTGRHRQRYDGNFRLVSGCIPYKMTKDDDNDDPGSDWENRLKVLMVSSPNRDDLVFPKGGWEDDESVEEAACREALEEAGVKGILNENPLGVWEFWSKSRDICSLVGGCRGYMFGLQVTEELEIWPEQGNRSRKWVNIEDALKLCRYDWMRDALDKFLRVIDEEMKHQVAEVVEELPHVLVSDVVATERPIMSSNCCVQTSSTQQHQGMSPIIGTCCYGHESYILPEDILYFSTCLRSSRSLY